MIITFYSFKGGVGRSHSLVETAAQLAKKGSSVLVWDLDLEAPGLQRIPALQPLEDKLKTGTLEVVRRFIDSDCQEIPFNLVKRSIVALELPEPVAAKHGRLDFLLPGRLEGYSDRFTAIDWSPLLGDSEMGAAFFLGIARYACDELGYEHLLIDARTGLTHLGALSTLVLPDLVVIVFNLNEQNIAGIQQAHAAIKARKRAGREIKVFPFANMVPDTEHNSKLAAMRVEKEAQLEKAGLTPQIQLPLRPELLLTDFIPTLNEPDKSEVHDKYRPLLDMIERETNFLDEDLEEASYEQQYRQAFSVHEKREIYGRAKRFEEKVAELFRLLGYSAEVDETTLERQFDVRLKMEGPITTHALVECKDTKRKVGIDAVEKFSRKVETASRHDKRRYQAILVSRNGFANNARAVADENFVELKSYKELQRSLVDLSPNLDHAIRTFQGTDLQRLYVEQEVVWQRDLKEGEKPVARGLTESVVAWLSEPGPGVLTLLGDFGVGKSSFCQRLACQLALAYQQDAEKKAPVLIDLRDGGSTTVTLENLLSHHFQQLSSRLFNPQALLHLNRSGHLVLIFDGFDETIAYTEPGHYAENLRQMLRAVEGEAKVILTCRTHYFRDLPEEVRTLKVAGDQRSTPGATALYDLLRDRPGSEIAYLREFEEKEIEAYLRKAIAPPRDWQETKQAILATYNLEDLAKRPFLLKLIVKSLAPALERAEKGAKLSIADLYEAYCESWFDHNDLRLTLTREHKVALVHYLARMLWNASRQEVHYEELAEKALDFYSEVSRGRRELSYLDKERVDYEVRTALFLHRDSRGYYRFIHRSFLEYFVAATLRQGLAAGDPAVLDLAPLTREVALFLLHWPEAEKIPELVATVLEAPYQRRVSENALRLLYFLARDRALPPDAPRDRATEEECDPAALRAAMEEIRPAKLCLAGADLRGADLRGVDLGGADLQKADLREADLRGASIAEANLTGANLAFADLRGAYATGALFTEADLNHADLRGADLRKAALDNIDLVFAWLTRARLGGATFAPRAIQGAALLGAQGLPREFQTNPKALQPLLNVGHGGPLLSLAFHPAEPILATSGRDGLILLWDIGRKIVVDRLPKNRGGVLSLAFSPDGKTLAATSYDHTIKLWNPYDAKLIHTLEGHARPVRSVAYSPDGKTLASASEDDTIKLWNPNNAKLIHTLRGHLSRVRSVSYSPDGKTLVSASEDGTIKLWNPNNASLIHTLKGHTDWVRCVAFSPDGKTLASVSEDSTLRLWNANDANLIHTLKEHTDWGRSVAYSPDGKTLAVASDDSTIKLWNPNNASLIHTLRGHANSVRSVAFNPDGKTLASVSEDNTVKLWNPNNAKLIHTLQGHDSRIRSVAFSPDGKRLAIAAEDSTVKLWNPNQPKLLHIFRELTDFARSAAFSPDGKTLALSADGNSIKLLNLHNASLVHTLEGHANLVLALAFSPDGKTLASASFDSTVKLWNPNQPKLLRTLKGHKQPVLAVAFCPAGKTLASVARDKTVKIWNPNNAKLVHTLQGHEYSFLAVAYSPDGKALASASSDMTVKIWNPNSGKLIYTLRGHANLVLAVAYSPDGRTLASASSDNTVKLWNAETGHCQATIALDSSVRSVTWHASGRTLVAGRIDGLTTLLKVTDSGLEQVAHLWADSNGNQLAFTPDGYALGDPAALDRLRFTDRWAVYEIEDVPERLDPERVRAAIAELF